MRLRAFAPNLLPDLKLPKPRNQPRTQRQADQQRRQTGVRRAERDVLKHVQHPERCPVPVQRIEKFVENVVKHCFSSRGWRGLRGWRIEWFLMRHPRNPRHPRLVFSHGSMLEKDALNV